MKFLRSFLDSIEPHFVDGKFKRLHPLYDMIDTFLYTPSTVSSNAPHIRDSIDLKRSMFFVVISLLPCFIFGAYNAGYQQLLLNSPHLNEFNHLEALLNGLAMIIPIYAVVFIVGGFWESIFAITRGHEVNEGFLVTGFLIPLVMPPSVPLWMVAVATTFGVVIGKEVFGGTGYNIFNPALMARAFIFFAYPASISGDKVWNIDSVTQATPLLHATTEGHVNSMFSWQDMFIGLIPGSIGETSTIAIMMGAIFLLLTGIASWRVMLSTFVGMVCTSLLLILFGLTIDSTNPMLFIPPHYHFVMGGFAFGMVFMATDPVSSAQTDKGRVWYGLLIGFMCVLIRTINPAYPEGMMLAILFANAFAPLFDYYVINSNIKKRKNGYR